MRFTRLELDNWKNFRRVDVALRPRVFVVGPNASGKSNLLDALRFLRDLARDGGGLQRASSQLRPGFKAIRSLHARAKNDVRLAVDVGGEQDGRIWTYELVLAEDGKSGRAVVKSERVCKHGIEVLRRPDAADRRDSDRLRQTYLESTHTNRSFRELVMFLASVEYAHVVPQVVRERRYRIESGERDPFGSDLLGDIAETASKERTRRLRLIQRALRGVLPQFATLGFKKDSKGQPHLVAGYKHWRAPLAEQREDQFSDGTLRLIGLLWSLAAVGGPLLLEEPELSLHAEAVRQIPQILGRVSLMSDRQFVVTTHAVEILSDIGIDPAEVLMLHTTHEDTLVESGSNDPAVVALARGGYPLGPELVAKTRAAESDQLSFSWK